MPSEQSTYTLTIKTEADLSAMKALIVTQEESIASARRMGVATAGADAQLEKMKADVAAYEKNIDDATKAVDKHSHSERETREELRKMGELAGPAGELLRYAFSGPLLALTALSEASALVKARFEECAAAVDQFNEANQAISDAKMNAMAAAAHDAAVAIAEAADAEEGLQRAYAAGNTAITNRLKLYNEEIDGMTKVEDAKEKAFEAEMDRAVATGKITKEQGEAAKEDARLQLDKFRGAADQSKLQYEITQRQKQLTDAQHAVRSGADAQAIADAQAGEAQTALEVGKAGAAVDNAKKQKVLFNGSYWTLPELQKERDKWQQDALTDPNFYSQGFDAYLNSIKQALLAPEADVAGQERLQTAAEIADKHAKSAIAIAQEKLKHDQDLNRTAPDQIQSLKDQAVVQAQTNAGVQAANTRAAQARMAPPDDGLRAAAAKETGAGAQAQIDASQTAANARILEQQLRSGKSGPENLQQIHETIERIIGFLENRNVSPLEKVDLSDILRRLNNLESQGQYGFGAP